MVDPVRLEIPGEVEGLDPFETHFVQQRHGGLDVGTPVPRTASAVDHDFAITRQTGH